MESANEQQSLIEDQLLLYFQQLFLKESLRKNLYIFKSLNENLQLHFDVIHQERKVMQILNQKKEKFQQEQQVQIIKKVLSKCPNILIKGETVQIKIEGDLQLVRVKPPKHETKNLKKKVLSISKNLRYQVLEIKDKQLLLQFLSHATVLEFTTRLQQFNKNKKEEQQWSYKVQPKDPYQSLKNAIIKLKKQRKQAHQSRNQQYTQKISQGQYNYYDYNYQNMGPNNYYNLYGSYWDYSKLEPFIRKAVDSQQDQKPNQVRTYQKETTQLTINMQNLATSKEQ